jgi:hypothetical protein
MRWTGPNSDVRDVGEHELWAGIIAEPRPHVAIVLRDGDGIVHVSRFRGDAAREMGEQLILFADQLNAANN